MRKFLLSGFIIIIFLLVFFTANIFSASNSNSVITKAKDQVLNLKCFDGLATKEALASSHLSVTVSASASNPNVGQWVNFTANVSTSASNAEIRGWAWDFGDGNTTQNNSSAWSDTQGHAYGWAGSFTVKVTVTQGYVGIPSSTINCWATDAVGVNVVTVPPPPTNLNAWCDKNGTISNGWSGSPGATYYALRMNSWFNGWDGGSCNPSTTPGDYCQNVGGGGNYAGVKGSGYNWWVHSCNSAGCNENYTAGNDFYCPPAPPSNPNFSCDNNGTISTGWSGSPGATYYALRMDNWANSWDDKSCNPSTTPGDYCQNVGGGGNYAGVKGSGYGWWLHACNDGGCSDAISGSFSCPAMQNLTVNRTGSAAGSGYIYTSLSSWGIDCGADCSENYNYNIPVTLATWWPAGVTFDGWNGGGCSGTGNCVVTMDSAKYVEAKFGYLCDETFKNNKFHVCFYDGVNVFSGGILNQYDDVSIPSPVFSHTAFDNNWGGGQIDSTGKWDGVTGIWRGKINFAPDDYIFYTGSDDGVRLYVNGNLEINNWTDHPYSENQSAKIHLSGLTDIELRWYENGGDARINFWWDKVCIDECSDSICTFKGPIGKYKNCGHFDDTLPSGDSCLDFGPENSCGARESCVNNGKCKLLPVIITFNTNKPKIKKGESATLSWDVLNVDDDDCSASDSGNPQKFTDDKPKNGNEVITPLVSTTYTLTCTNAAGTDSKSVTELVEIIPGPGEI